MNGTFFFLQGKDSLGVFEFSNEKLYYESILGRYKMATGDKKNWISWRTKTRSNEVVFWDTREDTRKIFQNISDWTFGTSEKVLILVEKRSDTIYELHWTDFFNARDTVVWAGASMPKNIQIQEVTGKIAFKFDSKTGGVRIAIVSLNALPKYIEGNIYIKNKEYRISDAILQFSQDGERLSFGVRQDTLKRANLIGGGPSVWHYRDEILQPQQQQEISIRPRLEIAYLDFPNNQIRVVDQEDEEVIINSGNYLVNDIYLILKRPVRKPDQIQYFYTESSADIFLYSFKDGSRTNIVRDTRVSSIMLSPTNKFLVYLDKSSGSCLSYNIREKMKVKISAQFPPQFYFNDKRYSAVQALFQVEGWVKDDEKLIVSDGFDLWLINPKGDDSPYALTENYGARNHIHLSTIPALDITTLHTLGASFILKGVNDDTYDEGYYLFNYGKGKLNVTKLWAGPFHSFVTKKNGQIFIILRSNPSEAPNFFYSEDFINYERVTNIQPQERYKWYTTKLIKWNSIDGKLCKGILYLPDNFDSTRKYPIVFSIYGRQSPGLNDFEYPALSSGTIEDTWFVSRGFLVFKPDIIYEVGAPGESAYNSVVSAAICLKQYKWIDIKHMGLSGSSLGAYAINYIVTRTKLFTAAAPGCGMTDLVSSYGSLRGFMLTNQFDYETGIAPIGKTLWARPDLYIKNSPIFSANKISTPLLILHNKLDPAVSWAQGIEWFLALRRLGKKAWLLEYDGEGHGVDDFKNQIDYTTRLQQFFDYYLKGTKPPVWMVHGISSDNERFGTGLESDTTGQVP